jgi:hypothetical protein
MFFGKNEGGKGVGEEFEGHLMGRNSYNSKLFIIINLHR